MALSIPSFVEELCTVGVNCFKLSVHECSFIKCSLWSFCVLNGSTPHSNGHNNGIIVFSSLPEISLVGILSECCN